MDYIEFETRHNAQWTPDEQARILSFLQPHIRPRKPYDTWMFMKLPGEPQSHVVYLVKRLTWRKYRISGNTLAEVEDGLKEYFGVN